MGLPSWTLVVSVLWSILGSLSGESRDVLHFPVKSFVTQHYLLGFISAKFYLFFVITKLIVGSHFEGDYILFSIIDPDG